MDKYLICICLILRSLSASAQSEWRVVGQVRDQATGETVEFAHVLLYSEDSTLVSHATTASDGRYIIQVPKPGRFYVEVSFVGCETYGSPVFELTKSKKDKDLGIATLRPSGLEIGEVEVTGRKRQIVYKLDKKVIETAGNIAASGGTAIDLLAQTPSVKVDAEGEISFRGSSGFRVYIDGKPSTLGGSAALESIPAEHIENIEIITTPSARNEADGTAGIINVVTKQQTQDGWSGLLSVKGSTLGNRGVNLLTSYRKKHIRWQTSAEASRAYRISDFDQSKTINDSVKTTTHSEGERKSYTDTYFLRSGLDIERSNNTWSFAAEGRYRVRNRGGALDYEDSYTRTGNTTYERYSGSDYVLLDEWTARGDIGFEHRFDNKGHKLSASFFSFYEGNAMEFFSTDLFRPDGSRAQGHRAEEYEYRLTAQGRLDYIRPIGTEGGKIEAGYYYFSYTEDGDYNVWVYDATKLGQPETHKPRREPTFGDGFVWRGDLYASFLFRRDIHALYAMLSNTHGAFSYQAGLRGEYRYRKLGSSEKWAEHVWHDFDLFPSIHTAYVLKGGSRLNLSYSRRVTQPELFYMEPYVVYVDYYTAQCGNPRILPEYTDSYEFSWSKGLGDHAFSASLFHRTRRDKIERVRVPYRTGVTLDSMANVGNDYATGAELTASLQIAKWWGLDLNGSLFDYRIRNDYKTGEDEQSLNWQLALSNNLDIAKNTRFRLEGYYVGPSVSTQGRVNDFFYFNIALRQQFMDKKLTATLNFRDVFSSARYVNSLSSPVLSSRTEIHPRWPMLMLSLTYTFNNFKSKTSEEKASHDLFEGTNR